MYRVLCRVQSLLVCLSLSVCLYPQTHDAPRSSYTTFCGLASKTCKSQRPDEAKDTVSGVLSPHGIQARVHAANPWRHLALNNSRNPILSHALARLPAIASLLPLSVPVQSPLVCIALCAQTPKSIIQPVFQLILIRRLKKKKEKKSRKKERKGFVYKTGQSRNPVAFTSTTRRPTAHLRFGLPLLLVSCLFAVTTPKRCCCRGRIRSI